MLHFIYSSLDGHLGFYFLTVLNNAIMNVHVQFFEWMDGFIFIGYILKNEIAESHGNSYA